MKSVFISYSHKDRGDAQAIAEFLRGPGLHVWIDEGEILVGESLVGKISQAIHDVDFLVALVSTNSADSSWVRKELSWAMTHEIEGKRVFVLPVVLDHCVLPHFLQDKLYADFRDSGQRSASLAKLLKSIDGLPINREGGTSPISPTYPVGTTIEQGADGRQQRFWGNRILETNRDGSLVCLILGVFLSTLWALLLPGAAKLEPKTPLLGLFTLFGLTAIPLLVAGAVGLLSIASFREAFATDPNLLIAVEGIRGYTWPFDSRWRRQWEVSRTNRTYRFALLAGTAASLFRIISGVSLFGLIALYVYMVCTG